MITFFHPTTCAGSHIYIYRNLRPYYKFVLPPEDVNTEEQDTWCAGVGWAGRQLAHATFCAAVLAR